MPRLAWCLPLLLFLAAAPVPLEGQAGRGSTRAERARMLETIRRLETEPLQSRARGDRRRVMEWLVGISDITVMACGALIPELLNGRRSHHEPELTVQILFSSAAFLIESGGFHRDEGAVYVAGVNGALRAYEAILAQKSAARLAYMDSLIVLRDAGTLDQHVRERARSCD